LSVRQESEGYAKVLTVLNNASASAITDDNVAAVARTLQSLIGCFDLDPNRVFDLVLDSLAEQPHNAALLRLVALFDAAKAAQLLGFKFQWHAKAEGGAPTPFGLYQAAAVLITAAVVPLDALYAHLAPTDAAGAELTTSVREAAVAAVKKIGVVNLAAKDDAADDAAGSNRRQSAVQQPAAAGPASAAENQKYGLVAGLLDMGAWDVAKGLIQRLQRAGMDPLSHGPAADALRRLMLSHTQHLAPMLLPTPIIMVTTPPATAAGAAADAMDVTPSSDADVASHAAKHPVMPPEVLDMLSTLTWRLSGDVRLFVRIVRLLRSHLLAAGTPAAARAASAPAGEDELAACNAAAAVADSAGSAVRDQVDTALRTAVLPALCLVPANPAAAVEVWALLRLFPYSTRFRLYAEWRASTSGEGAHPALGTAAGEALQETKKVLRRLSKDNVKDFGRRLGKLAHSCPLVVMHALLAQIEAYSSMIPPVVEALKYVSPLGYDCATAVLLDLLTLPRAKLKDDGQNVSLWLSSLASVAGQLVKRYPGVEVHALVRYLTAQLADGQTIDVLVLKEIIARTAGHDSLHDLSEPQLEAAAGSATLSAEAVSFGTALPPRLRAKGVARLKAALMRSPDPVAVPLMLLLAQARNHIVFQMESRQLKLIGMLYDQCCEVLSQYIAFLEDAMQPVDAYADLLPTLGDLVHTHSLEPDVAMALYRPVLRTATPLPAGAVPGEASALACGKVKCTWGELYGQVQALLPEATWQALSPALYVQFWSMTLYDLGVPTAAYEDRIERARSAMSALASQRDANPGDAAKRRREQERLKALIDTLTADRQRQSEHCSRVDAQMRAAKDSWLADLTGRSATVTLFLQTCVLPRCCASLPDAVFCARFVARLHSLGTPYFSTLQYYDRLLKDLRQLVFAATEHEAAALGRFLAETLAQLAEWKKSEAVYTQECASRPGFGHNFLEPDSKRASYADFVAVSFKWHSKLVRALAACLESSEFMEVRNALMVLTRLSKVYPVTRKHGAHLEKRVAKIKQDDPREDLKTLAGRYLAVLQKERSNWQSDEEFQWTGPGPYVPPKPAPAPLPAAAAAPAAKKAADAPQADPPKTAAPTAKPAPARPDDKARDGAAAPNRGAGDARGAGAPEKKGDKAPPAPSAAPPKRADDPPRGERERERERDRERERERDRDPPRGERDRDRERDRRKSAHAAPNAGGPSVPASNRPPPVPGARGGDRSEPAGGAPAPPSKSGWGEPQRDAPPTVARAAAEAALRGSVPPASDASGRTERRPAPAGRDGGDAPARNERGGEQAPGHASGTRERERESKDRDAGKRHKEKERKHDRQSRSRSRSRSRERRKDKERDKEKERGGHGARTDRGGNDKAKARESESEKVKPGNGGGAPAPPPLPPPPQAPRPQGRSDAPPPPPPGGRPRSRSPPPRRDEGRNTGPHQGSGRDVKRPRDEPPQVAPSAGAAGDDAKRRRMNDPPPPPPLPPPPPPPVQHNRMGDDDRPRQQQQQRRFPPAREQRPPPPPPGGDTRDRDMQRRR